LEPFLGYLTINTKYDILDEDYMNTDNQSIHLFLFLEKVMNKKLKKAAVVLVPVRVEREAYKIPVQKPEKVPTVFRFAGNLGTVQ